ncbi:uncharacterized protein [Chelonus insularis]|uniref:uncharacterized protein n=1 Tax=Chelonus insularis TaxID=460826 RepID=UPI00158F5E0C|nr:uncharacterized protein LOC118069125 [Chelonus insularis]
MGAVVAATSIVSGALYQPQLLPIDAKYPFRINFHPVVDIIYFLQILNGFQVGSITVIDTQVALLLWFSVARLDILSNEIKTAKNILQLRACIQKHQYLLWLIEEIIRTTRLIILTTVIMCMMSIILGSTHILGNDLIVKLQCISTALVLTFILYMNAYPAEFLIHACESIGWSAWSAFDLSESEKSSEFNRNLIFIIQKSQKPSLIKFRGILPGLSLTYYRAFLAKTFSFFTTLRVFLNNIEDDLNIIFLLKDNRVIEKMINDWIRALSSQLKEKEEYEPVDFL